MKKILKKIKRLAPALLSLGGVAAVGVLSLMALRRIETSAFIAMLSFGLGWYLGLFGQIIVHEAGHMVGGLISGYRFCSFRIGSFILVKDENGFRLGRFRLAGTGGQCLMAPPELKDGGIPTTLYNVSGVLANLLVSAVCALVYVFACDSPVGVAFAVVGLMGIYLALTNGIPLNTGVVDNDGRNAVSMAKDRNAQRAFRLQLKVNELSSKGMRLKDMPEEWFVRPTHQEMKNPITAAVGVLCCARLMDEMRFEEANVLMRRYLAMKSGLNGIHRAALVCDRIFLELIGENRAIVIEKLLTKQQRKLMKMLRTQLSVQRTEYALKLIYENDAEAAAKVLAMFDKTAKDYPYKQDVDSERELIALADKKYSEITSEAGEKTDGE